MNSVVVEAMVGVGEVVERASGRQQRVGVTGVCAQMVSHATPNVFSEMTSAQRQSYSS